MPIDLRIDYEHIIAALEVFLEAGEADRRDRQLVKPERKLERAMRAAFTKQGKSYIASIKRFKGAMNKAAKKEAVSKTDLLSPLKKAQIVTWSEMTEAMQEAIGTGLEIGGDGLMDALDIPPDDLVGFGFDVMNPEAIKYAKEHAAAQVTKINETTMQSMRGLIVQATEEGWSYSRLAGQIKGRFEGFSSARAKRIAVYELRDAYEAGQRVMIDRLKKHGLKMETRWLTAGDDRVRDSHRDSGAEGWQDVGFTFASGHERCPSDVGCRCTMLYRRRK